MKCPCCNSELTLEFQVGDFVEVINEGAWFGYQGYITEVDEDNLTTDGKCAYHLSVVDENKDHIDLTSWWDGPSLRLISGAGTYLQSYGELFNGL